jgi:hypothetical protein
MISAPNIGKAGVANKSFYVFGNSLPFTHQFVVSLRPVNEITLGNVEY